MHHPLLRGSVGCASTVNFFTFMIAAVYVLYASRTLGLSAGIIGITLGVGAVGALLGALVAPRIGRRIGLGRDDRRSAACSSRRRSCCCRSRAGSTLEKAALLCGVEFVSGFGVMLFDTNSNSMTALAVPQRLRARDRRRVARLQLRHAPVRRADRRRARGRDRNSADAAPRGDRRGCVA